ncbi:MAG TPA: hypothetical protein VKV25_07155 [Acidimicrobiales bacterium]|nr:hypothetical protein [Acidimicrobiales bacterium]
MGHDIERFPGQAGWSGWANRLPSRRAGTPETAGPAADPPDLGARWNLIFGPDGKVHPGLEQMLVESFGMTVSREPDAERPFVDLVSPVLGANTEVPPEVVVVRPGEFLSARTASSLRTALGLYWKINVLVSPYGWHPLPRIVYEDGAGGWTVTEAGDAPLWLLGHPLFWLETEAVVPDASCRYPHGLTVEDNVIRLWVELSSRGLADPVTGDVVDMLVLNGLDWRDEDVAAELREWAMGRRPSLRETFAVPPPDDVPEEWRHGRFSTAVALKYVRTHEPDLRAAVADDCTAVVAALMDRYDPAVGGWTTKTLMSIYEEAGERWANQERTAEGDEELLGAVFGTLLWIYAVAADRVLLLDYAERRRRRMFRALNSAASREIEAMRNELWDRADEECDRREDEATAAARRLFASPPERHSTLLTELWNLLATAAQREIAAVREVLEAWRSQDPPTAEEMWVPPQYPEPEPLPEAVEGSVP